MKSIYLRSVTREVWECSVSLYWLFDFTKKRKDDLIGQSTYDVVVKLIVPETIHTKCRYVDLIPSECVSTPTYFASHVWASPFLNLVESIRQHFDYQGDEEECKSIFIWIDIFAVNQHISDNQDKDLSNLYLAVKNSELGTLVCLDTKGDLLTR